MIVGSITMLSLVLVLFGLFARYVVTTTLMNSVDRDLLERSNHMGGPPPPEGDPGIEQRPPINPMQQQGSYSPDNSPPSPFPDQYGPSPNAPFDQGPNGQGQPGQPPFDQGGNGPPHDFARPQNDPYRPRRFDLAGHALDGSDELPWAPADIRLAASDDQPVYSTVDDSGVKLRIITRRRRNPQGMLVFIQGAYPLAQVDSAIAGVDRALLALIPMALIIAAFVGALVTKNVLDRVGQLVQTTATIGANDLSLRLPVVGRDEFAELAETFNALLSRVEGAFKDQERIVEQQRRFTADASHELKTPLTVIRGTTSLALSGTGALDRESTADIDSAAASMADLVQDLIYLARSDTGELGRKPVQMLLIEPLQRAVARVSSLSKVPIKVNLADETVTVDADESELARLFTNILQNAAQHTPSNGTIRVTVSSSLESALVKIQDNGVGIEAQHIPLLFERFYRVDSSRTRNQGGSGLGLSICKGIVEAHGGTIQITSNPKTGTEVYVALPRSRK
jgi:signal transduction histidine kinase